MTQVVDPHDYPPYKLTDAEAAATVGRYQENLEAVPAPLIRIEDYEREQSPGRTPAAPPGKVYVGDVYDDRSDETPVSAHDAAVAAYPPDVRSTVPDAAHRDVTGIIEAEGALEGTSPDRTHDELVAEAAAAKALFEESAAEDVIEPEVSEPVEEVVAPAEVVEEPVVEAPKEETVDPYDGKTVAELRTELGKRDLSYEYSARKADLAQLLRDNDAQRAG